MGKIIATVVTALILAIPGGLYWFYTDNAWASDVVKSMGEMAKEAKERRIREQRRDLNEINQKILDGVATKYDRLRKLQLERDYNEELTK